MPERALHKRKLKKNLAVLGMVMGFCAIVWAITMIRIADNVRQQTALPPSADAVE